MVGGDGVGKEAGQFRGECAVTWLKQSRCARCFKLFFHFRPWATMCRPCKRHIRSKQQK